MALQFRVIVAGLFLITCNVVIPCNGLGFCSFEETMTRNSNCFRNFFLSFRKNKDSNCTQEFESFVKCQAQVSIGCYRIPGRLRPMMIKNTYDSLMLQYSDGNMFKGMCFFDYSVDEAQKNDGVCNSTFRIAAHDCIEKFGRKYRENRGDPGLCKRYREASECGHKAMREHCRQNENDGIRAEMEVVAFLDKFNPFCDPDDKQ